MQSSITDTCCLISNTVTSLLHAQIVNTECWIVNSLYLDSYTPVFSSYSNIWTRTKWTGFVTGHFSVLHRVLWVGLWSMLYANEVSCMLHWNVSPSLHVFIACVQRCMLMLSNVWCR